MPYTFEDTKLMTPVFRANFIRVFRPDVQKDNKTGDQFETYSMTCLFEPGEDLSAFERAIKAALAERWGQDPTSWPRKFRHPIGDQGDQIDARTNQIRVGYQEGAKFVRVKTNQRPGVVGTARDPETGKPVRIDSPEEFFDGCYARATLRAKWYEHETANGVRFLLNNVQVVRKGERLGAPPRPAPEDEFEAGDFGDEESGADAFM